MLAHSFLIVSSSKLLITRTGIKARTSSILGLWFPWPIYMFFEMRFDLGTLGYLFDFRIMFMLNILWNNWWIWSNLVVTLIFLCQNMCYNKNKHSGGVSCSACNAFIDRIIINVAGNQDRHKSSDEFDFGQYQTTHFGVTCPLVTKILHFQTWISLKWVGQSWSNFMCSITGGEERLHNVLRQIGSKFWCPWQQKAAIDL